MLFIYFIILVINLDLWYSINPKIQKIFLILKDSHWTNFNTTEYLKLIDLTGAGVILFKLPFFQKKFSIFKNYYNYSNLILLIKLSL